MRGKIMKKCEYENKLRARGYQLIGSGLYSNVFAAPNSDKVIKVGDYDEWPSYIQWATQKGYAGTFAPKVFSLKFHDCYYVALMERLVCTISQLYGSGSLEQSRLYSSVICNHDFSDAATDFIAFFQDMRKAGHHGDLHNGNVMVRHDGQVVVTDPVAGGFSSEKFRIKSGACV
jgi:hypothetical protein